MRRPQPNWTTLQDARQHLIARGFTLTDAQNDIAVVIRERKVPCHWHRETITTFAGEIVHPQSPAIQALKRQGRWRLSPPTDLVGDDLDFENNSCKKPWFYPGFFAHVYGLDIGTKDFTRAVQSSEADPAGKRKATSTQKKRAVEALVTLLQANKDLRPSAAKALLPIDKFALGTTQFKDVWGQARRRLRLPPRARAGRPRKSSGQNDGTNSG
jgi:hypothetical protein